MDDAGATAEGSSSEKEQHEQALLQILSGAVSDDDDDFLPAEHEDAVEFCAGLSPLEATSWLLRLAEGAGIPLRPFYGSASDRVIAFFVRPRCSLITLNSTAFARQHRGEVEVFKMLWDSPAAGVPFFVQIARNETGIEYFGPSFLFRSPALDFVSEDEQAGVCSLGSFASHHSAFS